MQLRERIFELEGEVSSWKRRSEVEQQKEITSLRHQVSVLGAQKSDLEDRVEELESRIKQLHEYSGAGGGPSNLRQSEDRFLKEQRLFDEIEQLKRGRVELESVLLDRDTTIMEMRFEEEQHQLEVERLRRRNREVESAVRSLKTQTGGDTGGGLQVTPGTARSLVSKKHVDHPVSASDQHTIETMSRMIEELRRENGRLKASKDAGLGDKRTLAVERSLTSEKKRNEALVAEVSRLEEKLKGYADSEQSLVQRQQRISSMQKQIKKQQEEFLQVKDELKVAIADNEHLQETVDSLKRRIVQLEGKDPAAAGKNSDSIVTPHQKQLASDLKWQLEQKEQDIADLQRQLIQSSERVQELAAELKVNSIRNKDSRSESHPASESSVPAAMKRELEELRTENRRLHEELDVLDADFFEEIENLKYSYAQSVKTVEEYEQRYGPINKSVGSNNQR